MPIRFARPKPPPPAREPLEDEVLRLRELRRQLEARLESGHVTCVDVIAILDATKAPGT